MSILKKTFALGLGLSLATPAIAADNSVYGEARFNQLPTKGKAAHKIWVGSWWAYTRDGIADRHKTRGGFPECSGVSADAPPADLIAQNKAFCLSAAEKIDLLAGRVDRIEVDKVKEYQRITKDELGRIQTQLRDLVRKLNRWIAANPNGNWRETEDGKAYLSLNEELETKRATLPQIAIDTATEFERIEHGNGVPGVEGWWGHCNAWAAAALMEEEPARRGTVEHEGRSVEVTPGEAKALLTEGWMEHHSSFHGSRHDDPENKADEVTYADLTASGFHVYFGTQLGLRQKGFVIDRFTGSEVWNQPVRSYVWSVEKLYQGDEAVEKEIFQTEYNAYDGKGARRSLGKKRVYPVQVTASIHWVTDGLPHEVATVDNMLADAWPTNSSEMHRLWGNQIEMRTLTYTLDLDKPMEEPTAVVIGDGAWSHALASDNHAHPDFVWQPLTQTGSQRRYENPNLEFERIVMAKVLPATLAPAPPAMSSGETTARDVPKDIPDNNPAGVSSTINVATAGTIAEAFVKLDVTHTYRGDLRVVLEKDGKSVVLHDRTGGSADHLKQNFDLPSFRGTNAAGDWKLTIFDLAGQDVGKLNAWSVNLVVDGDVVPPPPPPPADEAGSGTFAAAGLPVNVPDNAPAGVRSEVVVEGGGTLKSAKVKVGVDHPYRGDLVVALEKDGETFVLHNRAGGSADHVRQTFDVPALVGKSARGKYVLKVSDHARRDVGKLEQFEVQLEWR